MVQYAVRSGGHYWAGSTSTGNIFIDAQSQISLNLDKQSILKMVRVGEDLLIYLASGEQVVVENFFVSFSGYEPNRLFLSSAGEFQEIEFEERYGNFQTAEYQPVDAMDRGLIFDSASYEATEVSTQMAPLFGGVGTGPVLGGLVGLGLLGAVAGGGGSESRSVGTTGSGDFTPPLSPVINIASGTRISGTGEPGATVRIDTNGDGVADLTTTVASNGTWAVAPVTPLANGTTVTATQTDPDGNQSPAISDTVDAIAPLSPVINIASGTRISGTGEPGATVLVDTNGDGVADLTTTVASNGTWAVAPVTPLANGATVTATQADPDGNQSLAISDTVDAIAPLSPVINIASGTRISGTGEPGATVLVDTNGDGVADLTTTVASNGTWAVAPGTPLANGTTVTATQADPDGNQSPAISDTVDAIAPLSPVINNASGTRISGTGEPGATVRIDTNGDGVADLTTTVASNGTWAVAPGTPLANGTTVTATQADPDGNQSPAISDTVDAIAPLSPVINIASGTRISGTGEPGATVLVDTNGDGVADLTTTVASNGTWAVAPGTPLANGTTVTATQADPDGNQSPAISDTVDAIAPLSPVINIASGTRISGTGEPGATVLVDTNGDGVADLTTTVASNGTWAVAPGTPLANGTTVTATQADPDGNQSLAISDTVDAIAPLSPVINIASGTRISGTGEPGATVLVDTNGDGIADLTTTVASNGTWAVAPGTPLANGTTVTATQADPDGNQSPAISDTVDTTPPAAPSVFVASYEEAVNGTAEAGSSVHISYVGDAGVIINLNPVSTSQTGIWNATPNPFLKANEDIYVSSTDADGNQSGYVLVFQGTDDSVIDFRGLSGDVAIGVGNFNIEAIDLSDSASNTVIITDDTLRSLSDSTDTLRIEGVSGNSVTASGAVAHGSTVVNGETYNLYDFAGGGAMLVDNAVAVFT